MKATTSRRVAAAAAILAMPVLSSCGVNFGAQTNQVYTPSVGTNNRDSSVDVLNALIVSGQDGTGRFIAGLANSLDQSATLTAVTGLGVDQQVDFTFADGKVTVPGNDFLQLADTGASMIVANGDPVKAGYFVKVQLQFSDAAPVEMQVPVVSPDGEFADVALPTPSAGTDASGG